MHIFQLLHDKAGNRISAYVQGVEIPIKEASFFVAYFFLDV